ncbi:alpha/beta hydrolase [Streptomyces sp. BI20]|uniref:alpha/beta hydrolase n=1 Tax=Streptomyces sp. BI20 TaxID=3403460 RepID=UPI003C747A10
MPGPAHAEPRRPAAVRVLLALAVVFVLLTTTGWTAVHRPMPEPSPRAAALAAWASARIDGRPVPAAGAPARVVSEFFARLSPAARTRLTDTHPLVVGGLDGAPVALRYRANRAALAVAEGIEEARARDVRLSPADREQAGRRAHRFDSLREPGRQILSFDPTGGGRAAEVFGDLGTAARISVVVPGVDTDVLTFERTSRRYTAPVGMARSLYDAERAADPRLPVAVIAWADYTSPVGLGVDAAAGRLAIAGAARLKALVTALPGTGTVALYCHSYGTVVCGSAAPGLGDRVTDLVVAGSPGMRVDDAAELGGRARVWALRDAGDWIADVPHLEFGGLGHGPDPMDPAFGARRLDTTGAHSHTGYFEPHTGSLDNFAKIGTGAFGSLVCAPSDPECRQGISGTNADAAS